jgi:hypothetical protein
MGPQKIALAVIQPGQSFFLKRSYPEQRTPSPRLAVGLASELEIDFLS